MQFLGCHDARNMITISEFDCPACHQSNAIEMFTRDGLTVGDTECSQCGFVIPDSVNPEEFLNVYHYYCTEKVKGETHL